MENKLYRSKDNRIVAGVCGGIAEHFSIDPTVVRLVAVVIAFATFFTALVAYLVCAIVMPEGSGGMVSHGNSSSIDSQKTKQILGVVLIAIGCLLFFDHFVWWFDKGSLAALSIAAIGGLLLYLGIKEKKEDHTE